MPGPAKPLANPSPSSRACSGCWPICTRKSRRRALFSTRPPFLRIRARKWVLPRLAPNFTLAKWSIESSTRPYRFTEVSATPANPKSSACTETPASSRSTRAPARFNVRSLPGTSCGQLRDAGNPQSESTETISAILSISAPLNQVTEALTLDDPDKASLIRDAPHRPFAHRPLLWSPPKLGQTSKRSRLRLLLLCRRLARPHQRLRRHLRHRREFSTDYD